MTIASGQPATAADVLAAIANGVTSATNASTPLLGSISALRSLASTGTFSAVVIAGYTSAGDGGGGLFTHAASDTTSTDNGATVIVDTNGRRWYRQSTANEAIDIRWFGVVGDGTTDVTVRLQSALTYIVSVGGTLDIPAGIYHITGSGVTLDLSGITIGQLTHVSIRGAGMGASQLHYTGTSGAALTVKGSQPNGLNTFCTIQGLQVLGAQQTGTQGIALQQAAAFVLRDVTIETFGLGISGVDVLQSTFENCIVGNCGTGVDLLYTNYSPPNAISFIGCDIVSNLNAGVILNDPATVNFFGGAIQGNGVGGSATNRYGVGIFTDRSSALDGAVGASFYGVYFEGNTPTADIWATGGDGTDGPSSVFISGCTFNRIDNTTFATNNVRCDIGASHRFKLSLIGNGFNGFNTYVASSSRPYVSINPSGGAVYDVYDQGNLYNNDIEKPVYIGPAKTAAAGASAWCYFDGTQANPSSSYGYNVGSITRVGVGDYAVGFEKQGPKTAYPAVVTLNAAGYGIVVTPSAANVRIQTLNASGIATDFSYVSVVVYGNGYVA